MNGHGTDFFISHAGRDTAWAEWLAWQLQQAGYSVELDVWDWAPGEDFVVRMAAALQRADRLLAGAPRPTSPPGSAARSYGRRSPGLQRRRGGLCRCWSSRVPGAATVGKTSRGDDAGKKVNGRKRHLVADTGGLLIVVLVTAAGVQDRDGGVRGLDRAKMAMPSLALVWADAAYSRRCVEFAARALRLAVQVVTKRAGQRGFVPLPRRWVVERTHAWITGHRRMSRDYEQLPAHAEAMIKWAMIGLMARRPAPASGRRPWQPMTAT